MSNSFVYKRTFNGKIVQGPRGGALIEFPYNLKEETGKGRLKVKATFDGVEYRGSIVSMGGKYIIGIKKEIRKKIKKEVDDNVQVVIEEDLEPREVDVPNEFEAELSKHGLLPKFNNLSYTHKREFVNWINSAKRETTKVSRITKAIEKLRKGETL